MHLHLWQSADRIKGLGTQLVWLSLPFFFDNYLLKTLYCEPYALNPAPNKTLEKVGFHKIREYVSIPGWLNFEQPVQLWQLTREQYLQLL
jgi:RimJ/RimL family protein N-acetyltransferase